MSDPLLGALHIEPGIWLNLPATVDPQEQTSVVRLATIPHGDALLAQGSSLTVAGGPKIESVSPIPLHHGTTEPITDQEYLEPYATTPEPPGIIPGAISDPNSVLQADIAGQDITNTVVLIIATNTVLGGSAGGIQNVPFVVKNANALSLEAIFWIETVTHPQQPGRKMLQLQYTQKVMLSFDGIDWPHISVATLLKH